MADIDSGGKLPHQSLTIQVSTVQSAVMFLLAHYFPNINPEVFISWGLISSYALRLVTKDKIVWYGKQNG